MRLFLRELRLGRRTVQSVRPTLACCVQQLGSIGLGWNHRLVQLLGKGMMTMSRRLAREVALRTLFQLESRDVSQESAFAFALETTPLAADFEPFALQLVTDAVAHQPESDGIIQSKAVDWEIARLARVDRSILRLALGELLAKRDVPTGVVVNEAVELANRYSTEESGKFINGILGSVVRDRPND